MIKFTKNLLFNPAEICISGIRCNFDNIAKISTIFDFKWTEVTIDSVKEGSSLLEFVKVQGLKNFIRHHSSGNIEMSVVVPCPLFEVFLDKAIKENPENIFMLNLLEPAGNVCLQQPFEELRWNLSRGFSAKHNVSENSVQNICRAVSPQRMRIIGSMVFFYL